MLRLLLILVLITPALAGPFEEANALAAKGKYVEALTLYQKAAEGNPDPAILYNAGLAAYKIHQFELAADYLSRARQAVPNNPQPLIKLIQTYQALERGAQAELLIEELRTLRRSAPSLAGQDTFVREQFTLGGTEVHVFEFFEPNYEERDHTWDFVVKERGGEQFTIYLMYDLVTSQVTQKQTYALDRASTEGGRENLTLFRREPGYQEVRDLVKRVLLGEQLPEYSR